MALSNPITGFGIHQATLRDKTTKEQHALCVIGDFTPELTQENIPLHGGKSVYPWDVAQGTAESTIGMTVSQYDLHVLKYLAGFGSSNVTENLSGDATGYVSSLTNEIGTSVFDATTGADSVAIVTDGNPIYGDYIIEATGADTVDVYLNNNLDGVEFQDDDLKITSSALTVLGTSGTIAIPSTDLEIVGGTGTIAMTTGDKASFHARPQNAYNYEFKGGAPDAAKSEFELFLFLEKHSNGKYRTLYFPRVKANGISFNVAAKEWASFETELMVLFDQAYGAAWGFEVIGR